MAQTLKITGYAKNLPDGSVEIHAEGEEIALIKFLESVQRGSLLSRVDGVNYKWSKPTNKHKKFSVVRSGGIFSDQKQAFKNLAKRFIFPKDCSLPKHVAIIPDGNRRWAKERGLPTLLGHQKGLGRFTEIAKKARQMGIHTLTLWGFSTENWDRSEEEIAYLFNIFRKNIRDFRKEAIKEQVRFRHLGRKDRLPKDILEEMNKLEEDTKNFTKYNLNLALDYGGRDDIVRAIKKLAVSGENLSEVDTSNFSRFLDTQNVEDPDFIIRTSGEQRISGLMAWQGVYAELYFTPLYFPDFDKEAFEMAILDYTHRQRRFGK